MSDVWDRGGTTENDGPVSKNLPNMNKLKAKQNK